MVSEGLRHIERGKMQEELKITPETLYDDNNSPLAKSNREKHNEAKRKGDLTAWYKCSDARGNTVGLNTISWGSVAGADEPGINFARHKDTRDSVALSHFDGDTVKPGEMPKGCTGLRVKGEIGKAGNQKGVKRFISENVKHSDPLIQAWCSAANIATLNGKPALAAAQDHLTLQIYPIALFLPQEDGGMDVRTKVNIRDIIDGNYDPRRIYEHGIPTISESRLTGRFIEMLQENARDRQEIYSRYPNLKKTQKIQQPRIAFLSTEIMSIRTQYPDTASIPGSWYKVIIPRNKIEGGSEDVTEENFRKSLDQLELAMSEGVSNCGDPDKPFSNTDHLVVQTESLDLSKKLALRAMQEESVREWSKLDGREIIIVQAISGIISDIARFTS